MTFRLYPNQWQQKQLLWAKSMHQLLYNAAIANRRTQYKHFKHSVDYFEQQASLPAFKEVWVEYKQLNAGSLQATLKRADYSYQRFFKGLGGYPKLKSKRFYSGWTYPDGRQGFKLHSDGKNGYLELKDLNLTLQMRGQAKYWGHASTCTIVYRHGKWYVSLTIECEPTRDTGVGAIGLDFGSKVAVASSNGELIESPKFLGKVLKKIKQISKQKRRKRAPNYKKKIQASKRWKKAQNKVSKLSRKAANQRTDWSHKTATEIIASNSLVATEKLTLKNLTRKAKKGKRKRQKAGLNRNLLDVGIGMLKNAIKYKLVEAGGVFVEVPTKKVKPTQRCASCWELTPKTLSDRWHICSNSRCGHCADRDINSAQVCLIWARGMERTSLSSEEKALPKDCGSFRQLSSRKSQKPPARAQRSGVAGASSFEFKYVIKQTYDLE